ncbi:MAG: M2 family metallopeptidase [Henriciella sp.]|nr:M2 family metallopeptidase [Henriciella sp.]
MTLKLMTGAAIAALMLAGCNANATNPADTGVAATYDKTVDGARAYIEDAEAQLAETSEYVGRVYWNQATNITFDTSWLAAKAGAEYTTLAVDLANGTKQFEGVDLPDDLARKFQILRSGIVLPAPSKDGAAEELSNITTGLDSTYATGTFNYKGEDLTLDQLSTIIETSRDPAELKAVWEGWRTVSPPMRDDYGRMVEIANEGANELGFENLADMWLSNYDMPPEDMRVEVDRLWTQVEPLYEDLHCYVRSELNAEYGDEVQPANGPIRADLLGNMWSQGWSAIYPLVAPPAADPGYDVTERLVAEGYDPLQMVKTGEQFFSSLGFEPLPETFWERSQITRPRDREVVCHASAWDLDNADDIRIKMCTEVNSEDFQTVHHELGHNYYQRAYKEQDFLHKNGANDGFHEAIGDFIALSITPEYLKAIGLIDEVPPAEADLGLLMNTALDKIAFLPFAVTVDSWRWDVLDGTTPVERYNDAWWETRTKYQGIVPPGARPSDAFDPGAKYHIPGNTPYLRYFLSYVMQFQFHKAACEQAGWEGPLHRCSIYDNAEVGANFRAMMELGASKPWPDALEAFTGTRQMDGSAITEYFAPLTAYLKEQNQGQTCGWE